jgi:hypothetical protein
MCSATFTARNSPLRIHVSTLWLPTASCFASCGGVSQLSESVDLIAAAYRFLVNFALFVSVAFSIRQHDHDHISTFSTISHVS